MLDQTIGQVDQMTIEGDDIPVYQLDEYSGRIIVSVDVAEAVHNGFNFAPIYRHNDVNVSLGDEDFQATIASCEIEHGIAAIRLAPGGQPPSDESEQESDPARHQARDDGISGFHAFVGGAVSAILFVAGTAFVALGAEIPGLLAVTVTGVLTWYILRKVYANTEHQGGGRS